ncbi:MAG: hypothetical protein Q9205_004368 [Flavoplaca limonia]
MRHAFFVQQQGGGFLEVVDGGEEGEVVDAVVEEEAREGEGGARGAEVEEELLLFLRRQYESTTMHVHVNRLGPYPFLRHHDTARDIPPIFSRRDREALPSFKDCGWWEASFAFCLPFSVCGGADLE